MILIIERWSCSHVVRGRITPMTTNASVTLSDRRRGELGLLHKCDVECLPVTCPRSIHRICWETWFPSPVAIQLNYKSKRVGNSVNRESWNDEGKQGTAQLGTFILNTNISSVFEFFFQHRRILVLLLSSPLADFLRLCCHGITTTKKLERNGQSSSEGALFFAGPRLCLENCHLQRIVYSIEQSAFLLMIPFQTTGLAISRVLCRIQRQRRPRRISRIAATRSTK